MKKDYRRTDFQLSELIQNLYGKKDYKKIKSHNDLTSAKKYYLKVIKSIQYSIEETLTITDNLHKTELQRTIQELISSITAAISLDELDQCMIALQSELIFLLIGYFPRRLNSEGVINNRNLWKLDLYRQICYTQTDEQRKNLIFKAVKGKYKNIFGHWDNFKAIYSTECKNRPDILVNWIRTNHPDMYLELF